MEILPNDIITKNKTTWLAHSFMLRTLPGLTDEYMCVSRTRYKSTVAPSFQCRDILPDTGKSWRFALINGSFYYAYNNIPDKAPSCYRSQLPPESELITNTQFQTPNSNFNDHFTPYITSHYTSYLSCYGDCTSTQQANLAKAAAITEGAIEYIRTNNVNTKKYHFFDQLAAFIKKYDVKYFPENARVIKRKLEPLLVEAAAAYPAITDVIKLPRSNNDNAAKGFNDEEIRSWVLQLRDMGQNYTNAFIIRKIKDMCTLTTKPMPGDRWIGSIMETHNTKFLTARQRYGAKGRGSAIYRGYQPFQNALFAGDCWQIDGTRFNLVENKKEINGKMVTPFLYIIAVRDVHSGMIIGHHYTISEDHFANYCALENAIRNTGYLPFELVHDRFPGHNTEQMSAFLETLEQWGVKLTVSSDPNSKAHLERWFGTLQTVFMQDSQFYYGQGIKSKRPYAHRSEEYMKKLRQQARAEGWDWDAACAEADIVIENYNATQYCQWSRKHKTVQQSPATLHEVSEKPHTITLTSEDYAYLLGVRKPLRHVAGLIETQIQNVPYYYRITDYNIIANNEKVLCCFDYFDLSKVQLYIWHPDKSGATAIRQYLGYAHEEVPAQVHGPNPQWDVVAQRKAVIKDIAGFAVQEADYRKAVGDDIVSLIYPTTVNKHTYEAAESAYLNPRAAIIGNNTLAFGEATDTDDDTDFEINVRNQY